jgi:hypothetical protein
MVRGVSMATVVYVPELPKKMIIKVKDLILVGTGLVKKGDDTNERLCTQEGE